GLVLATQTQAADQAAVTAQILAFQVVQQLATLVNHADQTATGVVILLVVLEVPLQLVDVCSQQSYLDFRRTGVAFSTRILGNDCRLFLYGRCHDRFPLRYSAWILFIGLYRVMTVPVDIHPRCDPLVSTSCRCRAPAMFNH